MQLDSRFLETTKPRTFDSDYPLTITRTLRILHLLHTYQPKSRGGIESYVHRLVRHQLDTGLQPIVLAGREHDDPDPDFRATTIEGVTVLRPPAWSATLATPLHNPTIDKLLPELLAQYRIDLAHIHHWHNLGSNLCALNAAHDVPTVLTIHDYFVTCPWLFRRRDRSLCAADTSLATCADCTAERTDSESLQVAAILEERQRNFRHEFELAAARLTISEDLRSQLGSIPQTAGIPFECLGLPGPDPDLSPLPAKPGPATGRRRFRVVCWGGLVEGKGLDQLLAACELLEQPIELHHFGRLIETSYADQLRRDAVRTTLHLHGSFDTTTMRREFPRFDLAVFPSLFRETYGLVVDEAMQLGLPVLVSDRGAPKERIGGRGVVFPPEDVEGLAALLAHYIRKPDRLAELRAACPPPVMSMAEHAAALHRIYDRAVRSRPRVHPDATQPAPAG